MPTSLVLGIILGVALTIVGGPARATTQTLPPPPTETGSPWTGNWVLSGTRNEQAIKDAAAKGYRFRLDPDGRILWEIPSLHEVVQGRTDGQPMTIHRPGLSGMTLAVTTDGPRVLLYTVAHDGNPQAKGRMTLVDRDTAWVDITEPAGRADLASAIIYVRGTPAEMQPPR